MKTVKLKGSSCSNVPEILDTLEVQAEDAETPDEETENKILGCVSCCRPLLKCHAGKRINWALANNTGEVVDATSNNFTWQEAEGEVYVSSCGHLYHKKCLFDLFSDISEAKRRLSRNAMNPNLAAAIISSGGLGLCAWCSTQMIPANCVRIHLKPKGNPLPPKMLRLINYNNVLRDHIMKLTAMIKKKEALLRLVESDTNFLKKIKSKNKKRREKHGRRSRSLSGSRTDSISESRDLIASNLKAEEDPVMDVIANLNTKLISLLEESTVAKETMAEVFSQIKCSPSTLAKHFDVNSCDRKPLSKTANTDHTFNAWGPESRHLRLKKSTNTTAFHNFDHDYEHVALTNTDSRMKALEFPEKRKLNTVCQAKAYNATSKPLSVCEIREVATEHGQGEQMNLHPPLNGHQYKIDAKI